MVRIEAQMAFDLKRMKKTDGEAAVDNVDVMHEIFRHLDAKTLSLASCVSKIWCEAAKDDNLWEVICTQHWPPTGISIGRLRSVVNVMGGFRHLYVKWLHPLQRKNGGDCGKSSLIMWSEDQVQLSLSLFSVDYYKRDGCFTSEGIYGSSCTLSRPDLLKNVHKFD